MKKIIALIMAIMLIPQSMVFANTEEEEKFTPSIEYQGYETIAKYITEKYIDDSYTVSDIMLMGMSAYLQEHGDEALAEFVKGALHQLDDYSDFFTRDEYIEYMNSINRTFYGLGVTLQQAGEYVEIAEFVEPGGLAEQSGFKVGDKFVSVDGKDVVGFSISEVRSLVIGEINTTVDIVVMRGDELVPLVGIRTAVSAGTVSGVVLEDNIGYIVITSFANTTAEEFKTVSDEFQAKGVKKVILDLRNNLGGHVSAAVGVAEQIVPKGKIIDVKYRDSKLNYTYKSKLEKSPFEIVTLVNKDTASSSEILASAIQDSGVGILLGENTYGKAVIQNSYPLNNGMVLKLTIGKYITRNGEEINKIGLSPDELVKNATEKVDTSKYTKFDFLTPASLGDSGQNVMAAKERLAGMGYYSGNMQNNVYNVDLKEAIANFQRNNGMADSGVLDVATQIKLKEVFENMSVELDTQLERAYQYLGGDPSNL